MRLALIYRDSGYVATGRYNPVSLGKGPSHDRIHHSLPQLQYRDQAHGVACGSVDRIDEEAPSIDEIDTALVQHYGFTAEELGFNINYDIKYRMGGSDDSDNE